MSNEQLLGAMLWMTKFTFRAICGAMTAIMYQIHGDYAMSTEMLNALLRMSKEIDEYIIQAEGCDAS